MNTLITQTDAIQLSIASAIVGSAMTVILILLWFVIQNTRAARYRRNHCLTSRALRPSTHL